MEDRRSRSSIIDHRSSTSSAMMPLRRFTIHQPKTIAEASQMLGELGEKACLYAGGTELLLAMKHDLLRYEHLIDVKTIAGLSKIELKNGSLMIGDRKSVV